MDEATAQFLVSEAGRCLLRSVAALPGDGPDRVLVLRKRGIAPAVASGAVEVADARRRARSRFPDAENLFFTAAALAQATSPAIAAYRAARLAPFGSVVDLCCGVGMDALALAEAGAHVQAVERDAARLVFARANAQARPAAKHRIAFVQQDVTRLGWEANAAFWDPSRRVEHGANGAARRVSRHAEQYEPPLSFLETVRARVPDGGCVKLSPGLPDPVLAGLKGRVEFLSEGRECKEACVWFGNALGAAAAAADDAAAAAFAAVLLPEQIVVAAATAAADTGGPSAAAASAPAGLLGAFVHDPDPAIVRAGALDALASRIRARRISADDEYLTGDAPARPRRLALSYRVVAAALPYAPIAPLRDLLRARGVGRVIVKKRHLAQEPAAVERALRLPSASGGSEAVLILVRQSGRFLALVCEPFVS